MIKQMIHVCLISCLLFFFSCSPGREKGKTVLSGNSMITSLIRDLTDTIRVINLIPPASCPGHFDLKPEDAEKVTDSHVLVVHPFQKYLFGKVKKVNPGLEPAVLKAPDLTIPRDYYEGLAKMENILKKYFPERGEEFQKNKFRSIKLIKNAVKKDRPFLEKIRKNKYRVLSSKFQDRFAEWLGMEVVGVFGGPDNLTVRDTDALVKLAKEKKIDFIVSNFSGDHNVTAEILSKNLTTKIIIFSNFPDLKKNKSYFLNLWHYNIHQLEAHTDL